MFIGFTLLLHRPIIGCDPKLSALKIFNSPPVPTFCLDLIWRPSPACDPLIVVSFVVADVTCDDIAAS